MIKLIKSLFKSISHGVKNDPEVQRIYKKHPRLGKFLKTRITPNEKYGLYLTIGILIVFYFIYLFFGIVEDYIGHEALIRADLRIINLISQFRTDSLNHLMLFITYLAKGETIVIGVILASIILFLFKKKAYLYSLLISVIGGQIFVWIIKNIIERPRPPLTEALVTETSYSFPSGHSFVAVTFYGLLFFFISQSVKKRYQKNLSLIIGLILIILVGFSRIYLGAHWPSDVLASYASGLAWLTIIITTNKIKRKFNYQIVSPPHLKHKTINKLIALFLVLFFGFVYGYYLTHPLKTISQPQITKTTIKPEEIDSKLFANLPKISETITGASAEPINIIVVASKDTLIKSFTNSGWYVLDKISLKTSFKIVKAVITKESYHQTPGLPVFWDTRSNDLGFGKPTPADLASSRHHIHFWETSFITPDGQSVWVGTAHFDQSIQKKGFIILPIHSTELIVDKEREELKSNLEENNVIKFFEKIDLTGLTYGTKKSGNNFLTDGQAYILYLKK